MVRAWFIPDTPFYQRLRSVGAETEKHVADAIQRIINDHVDNIANISVHCVPRIITPLHNGTKIPSPIYQTVEKPYGVSIGSYNLRNPYNPSNPATLLKWLSHEMEHYSYPTIHRDWPSRMYAPTFPVISIYVDNLHKNEKTSIQDDPLKKLDTIHIDLYAMNIHDAVQVWSDPFTFKEILSEEMHPLPLVDERDNADSPKNLTEAWLCVGGGQYAKNVKCKDIDDLFYFITATISLGNGRYYPVTTIIVYDATCSIEKYSVVTILGDHKFDLENKEG